jgi:hypothetical protein
VPWPKEQREAIAARMRREGKTKEQISAFFRSHGHGGGLHAKMQKGRKKK